MFNLDAITNKNNKDEDKKWPYIIVRCLNHFLKSSMWKIITTIFN